MTLNDTLTAVPGLKVGHATDPVGLTGCTVVLCEGGAVGGVDQRGGAPGTRETDLLRPMHLVQKVHGVLLAGGSAFGLAAADGVMRYLTERGIGVKAGPVRVPIVPAAILFDLAVGSADARPDAEMGYAAVLYPVTMMRVAMKAVEAALGVLASDGTQRDLLDLMQTRQELYDTIGYEDYEARDREYFEATGFESPDVDSDG